MRLGCRRLGVACSRGRVPAATLVLLIVGAVVLAAGPGLNRLDSSKHSGNRVHRGDARTGLADYRHRPMAFEANQGQSDSAVKFLARGSGYGLFLTESEAVLTLQARNSDRSLSVLEMGLVNANPNAQVIATDKLPGRSNYFIGNDPAKWHRDIPQYAGVRYDNVYPGIDLVFYGSQGQLEYDFEIAPGADPRQVALKFRGADKLKLNSQGDLVLAINGSEVRLQSPRVYQKFGEEKRPVPGRFVLLASDKAGFELGAYDRSRAVVIDPVLNYSTYFGGNGDEACSVIPGEGGGSPISGCPAVAVDSAFNAYIAGSTTSTVFPTAGSPFQSGLKGKANVFVAKFNSAANTLEFSTYLGGNGTDYTTGLTVDPEGNVYVAGNTNSSNFPSNNAFQPAPVSAANNHAFVSKLDPAGHTLLYSTYLSGNGIDTATGLALDPSGNAYITGTTTSTESETGFPSTLGAIQTASKATNQFFLTKVNPTLSGSDSVQYSTYFGGSNPSSGETKGGGVAVDINSIVYITGGTNFTDMPVLNAFQGTLKGGLDVFVARINPAAPSGTQLLYSSYIGGSLDDIGFGIATDGTNAYVTGSTASTDFPAGGTGVFQSTHNAAAGNDAFLAKLANPVNTGTTAGEVTLSYFTYLGGSGDDVGLAIALDSNGSGTNSTQGARITGWTNSGDFPVINTPVQAAFGGGSSDAFVARIDTTATSPTAPGHYSTFLGGAGNDYGTGIAADTQGASYVAGETSSADLLATAPPLTAAFQPALDGGTDAFLSKLGPQISLGLTVAPSVSAVGVGNQVNFVYTITNTGDFTSGVSFTDNLLSSPGTQFVSASGPTSASCGGANNGVVGCTIGALNAGATATVTIGLTPTPSTIPATSSVNLTNCGTVSVSGTSFSNGQCSTTAVAVNDFNITIAPATATVPAGVPATFTATVTPTGSIPSSVSISCSNLPTDGACPPGNNNPIPNLENGAASSVVIINTQARVTTTTQWWQKRGLVYAMSLPISGLALLTVGIGGVPRRRRALMALLLGAFFTLSLFQAGCSSSKSVTTTTGTPAGTYTVTISATSGATRSTTVTLVVQ